MFIQGKTCRTRILYYHKRMAHKQIRLDKKSREAIQQQIAAFRKKFGREPGPNDPIFFDPDADTPQPYPEEKFRREWNEVMDEAVRTGGIRPELAYAAKKTGFIVTASNKEKLTRQQLKEWDDAVQEIPRFRQQESSIALGCGNRQGRLELAGMWLKVESKNIG